MAVGVTQPSITWVLRLLSALNQRIGVLTIQVLLALKLRIRGAVTLRLPPFLGVMQWVDLPVIVLSFPPWATVLKLTPFQGHCLLGPPPCISYRLKFCPCDGSG